MGRSTTSCFKIISCGSDSVDRDDLEASENKGSYDKRGWSFRKKSVRHRVLSNTVVSETPSGNKEGPESANVDFYAQANSDPTIPEKTFGTQWKDERPQLSTSANSKMSESISTKEGDLKFDVDPDESVIVVIQAAIRGYLAQRALLKHKNIVKLQAAVRGHLVRSHAVGTLRCVQAIVKMQALVRARRARLYVEGSSTGEKGKQNSGTKPHLMYTSTEKLLSNRFARQLLESKQGTKSIKIKCDPSRSDSAWKWLERWMSVSSTGVEQPHTPDLNTELQQQEKVKYPESQVETVIPSEDYYKSTDLRTSPGEAAVPNAESSIRLAAVPSDCEENLITYDADNFDIQACPPASSLISHTPEHPQTENTGLSNLKEDSDLLPNQTRQSDFIPQMELNSLPGKPELDTEQPKRPMKGLAPEQPETEERMFVLGSRKESNPAFIAAQSKFEELTSTTNLTKSISSSNQDLGVQSCMDTVSSATNNIIRTRDTDLVESSVSHTTRVQVGGSECGTELSISSTLDSPDQSDVGAVEFAQEAKILEGTDNPKSPKNLDVEAKVELPTQGTDLSYSISVQPDKHDIAKGADVESLKSVIGVDSSQVEQKLEEKASDVQIELESETSHQVYKSSPEASPRSHITVPESQGTPASQSTKAKKTGSDKNRSNQKRKSMSAGKRSPIDPNNDSGVRSSLEQLPREHKTGKRRNSFGSARPDPVDQEPRDSSSSNSLPSYMQATESARAKAHANNSPRSSPDVLDKDIFIKKRHSLPGANDRHGSPRIKRSMSQAQQSPKGNGTNPPRERKWQR